MIYFEDIELHDLEHQLNILSRTLELHVLNHANAQFADYVLQCSKQLERIATELYKVRHDQILQPGEYRMNDSNPKYGGGRWC